MAGVLGSNLKEFYIRQLEASDVPKLKALADEEDWNDSAECIEFMRNLSGGGFMAAFGKDGQLLSHCGSERISEDLGMVIFYVTHPDYRGRGIGRKVFDACMENLGNMNVAVTSADVAKNIYASLGFVIKSFWMSVFRGIPKIDQLQETWSSDKVTAVDVSQVEHASLAEYDDTIHIIPRRGFLKKWLAREGMVCKVAVKEGNIVGYGCIWPSVSSYMIMPLYADDRTAAQELLKELCVQLAPGKQIEVAAPSENTEAIQLFVDSIDLVKPRFNGVRLFTKKEVKVRLDPVYSLCSHGASLV